MRSGERRITVAVTLGLSLLGAQAGIAAAAPSSEDPSAVSTAGPAGKARQESARRDRPRVTPKYSAVQRDSSSKLARRAAAPTAGRNSTARAVAPNPIVSFLFNSTPTLDPRQSPPDPGGVIHGSLNADDPDGNSLEYSVVRNPEHGEVAVAADGTFTYAPADPGQLFATDTFEVGVSDAGDGFHLHGLMGLINLLTFGLIGTAGHTSTRTVTVSLSPTVDTSAYLLPVAPGVTIKPLLTVGDSPSDVGYPMVGSPDGLGLYNNNDGTFTLLMNHELSSGAGAVRAHGATGSFISMYVIDAGTLRVVGGSDLISQVFAWNAVTQSSDVSSSTVAFNRFCSGDLAAGSAYSYNGVGTTARIFLTGEEGGSGRAVATVANGPDAGKAYVLGAFSPGTNGSGLTGTPSWENLLANPYGQEKTVVIGNNDGGSGVMAGAIAVYVGTKQNVGTEADRAGLTNGVLKFVSVAGNAVEIVDAATRATTITSGTAFTLSAVASTTFSRPEDGAWNPLNPNEYYFVTTDRLD